MSEPLKGVVVSHAALAAGLVDAVRQITGEGDQLIPVSNEGCDTGLLASRLKAAIGDSPAVVFVDLPGGSCLNAAVHHQKTSAGVAIVAGVNLAMLLDFIYQRDLTPVEAAKRAVEHGGRAVRAVAL